MRGTGLNILYIYTAQPIIQMRKTFCLFLMLLTLTCNAQVRQLPSQNEPDSVAAERFIMQSKENMYNNPETGKLLAKKGLLYSRKAGNSKLQARAYNCLGLCHRNISEYDSAIACFNDAARLFKLNNNNTGYGNAINNMAMTIFYKGDYEKSNRLFLEVIKEAEAKKLNQVLSNAYQNLGIVNTSQERYTDALNNFKRAEEYHELSKDLRGKTGAAINQAFIYFKYLKQYDKAIAIYKRVLPVKMSLQDQKGVGICYNNLAEAYLKMKDFNNAHANINKAIPIRLKINDRHGQATSYHILADILFHEKKYAEAERYARKAIEIAKAIGAKKEHAETLRLLSQIQEATKNITDAYTNYVKAVAIKDSLLNRENFARMAELETKYETEKKERQILQQRAKIAESQVKIDRQKMVILIFSVLGLIAILAGFVFFYRQKIKSLRLEKEAELKEALIAIETQNKLQQQRLQISRDLHDNIGAQLTFIISSLDNLKYGFTIPDERLMHRLIDIKNFTRETITELRDTIWAMNKDSISLLDLRTRISNFIDNAKAASRGIEFIFETDPGITDSVSFSSIKGINLYRIIQESVNNALKHAEAKHISVFISKQKNEYRISIADDGKGFNHENVPKGNGLDNIRKRVADCNGLLTINSTPGGTTITVTVK